MAGCLAASIRGPPWTEGPLVTRDYAPRIRNEDAVGETHEL